MVKAMLGLGEFEDGDARDAALARVRKILEGYSVVLDTDLDDEVQISGTGSNKRQNLIDAMLHTALGSVLSESDFQTARSTTGPRNG